MQDKWPVLKAQAHVAKPHGAAIGEHLEPGGNEHQRNPEWRGDGNHTDVQRPLHRVPCRPGLRPPRADGQSFQTCGMAGHCEFLQSLTRMFARPRWVYEEVVTSASEFYKVCPPRIGTEKHKGANVDRSRPDLRLKRESFATSLRPNSLGSAPARP